MKNNPKSISPSKLRENIYRILDQVLNTGVPVEIDRNGKKLKIIVSQPVNKLKKLKKRKYFRVDPESIVHMDWSEEWNADDLS